MPTNDMRLNASFVFAGIAAFAGVLSGCGEHRAASPLSPSVLSSRSSEGAQRAGVNLAPRRVDHDGDGYEDHEPGPPADPGTNPPPDSGTPPNPEPPPPEGLPGPVQLTISVIGSFGNGAFAPNPLQAAIGNTIVWMNNDLVQHDIVLDDGTPVGNLAPGQGSAPITLVTETAGYRCTFHPTMVGQVTAIPIVPPVPTDPSQGPTPDPTAPPPPPPDDPDDDGYDDGGGYGDYYIR
jgi:hypothetical protein